MSPAISYLTLPVYLCSITSAILQICLYTSGRLIIVSANEINPYGVRGAKLEKEHSTKHDMQIKSFQQDSPAITMAEMIAINRRTQSQDEIHLNLSYNNHPHEIYRYLQAGNVTLSPSSSTSSSETSSNVLASAKTVDSITSAPTISPSATPTQSVSEPIRIFFETTELDLIDNPYRIKAIKSIKEDVLPEISDIWSSILSVIPVVENIPIPSNVCNGRYINIPPNIQQNGVGNADVVIFVSGFVSSNGKNFCSSRTLASANFCHLDQIDRPVIGFINFCLSNYDPNNVEKMVKIGIHESAHVLGWNDDLLKYFRNRESGKELTSRPFITQKVNCVDGSKRDYELPAENTVAMKKDWSTGVESIYYEVVTPRIRQAARNQFGCQILSGARLENQPTRKSCIGAHFDERYFFTEVMGPVLSSPSATTLSALTLAMMEDTGFYEVHYHSKYVQNSAFGLGAGCDFVTDSCVDLESETVKDSFRPYFCDTVTKLSDEGIDQAASSTCDPSFTTIAYCDLFDFSDGAPKGFERPDEDTFSYFSDQNLGVLFTHGNYCPIPAILAIDCIEGPISSHQKLYPGEEYGRSSNCVNTKFEHPVDGPSHRGACLRTSCNAENRTLTVHVDGESLVCEFDGQEFDFPWTQSASFTCPPLRSVCPQMFCPGLCSAKGVCNYQSVPPKCECFDDEDKSEGCYGRDYELITIVNEEANKKPNSSTRNSMYMNVALPIASLFITFYI